MTAGVVYRKDSVPDKKLFIHARRYMSSHAQAKSIRNELKASDRRLVSARAVVPGVSVDEDGKSTFTAIVKLPHVTHHPTLNDDGQPMPLGDARLDAEYADHEFYPKLKAALYEWETKYMANAPASERTFYQSLRSVLVEALRAEGPELRREKFRAAYVWFLHSRPSVRPLSAAGEPERCGPSDAYRRLDHMFNDFRSESVSSWFGPCMESAPEPSTPGPTTPKLRAPETPGATPGSGRSIPATPGSTRTFRRSNSGRIHTPGSAATPRTPKPKRDYALVEKARANLREACNPSDGSAPRYRLRNKKVDEDSKWPAPETDFTDDDVSEASMDLLNHEADVESATTIPTVRRKWHAHEQVMTHSWLTDIKEDMAIWDIERARIDEETIRRLQSRHGANAYPPRATQPSVSRYTPNVQLPDYEGKEEDIEADKKHNWKITDANNFEDEYWQAYKWEEVDE